MSKRQEARVRTGREIADWLDGRGEHKRANDVRSLVRSAESASATLKVIHGDAARLREVRHELLRNLVALEWGGPAAEANAVVDLDCQCLRCGSAKRYGHTDDCELKAAIRLGEEKI